ncbi:signal transduction histidine kinase [Haloechinothrix halophila YIM 93223]|uniref:Signal transduction histidine kinase n=2 Tax=Haloechinothrix TaxID=1425377 RepID=W9DRN4_9PSEU|nr:signal transduction histidine kinase [Haloechinothrix halophila YIM 93223]
MTRRRGSVLAGVAGGIADHLGVDVFKVRMLFAALCVVGGAGFLAYGLLWVFVPQRSAAEQAPGSAKERRQAVGLIALGIGLAVVGSSLTGNFSGWITGPLALALIGAVLVWREADESQQRRWRAGPVGAVLGGGGWPAVVRIVAGVALVVAGVGVVTLRGGSFDQVQFALLAVFATLVGVAVLTVPFWLRLVRDLGEERAVRIRTEERAEIAAHLHDSVLQTLALIQRQSESPKEVARLARGQERQLRTWLYGAAGYGADDGSSGDGQAPAARLSDVLGEAAGEVEDAFAVSVQHVVVGDADLTPALTALVQAAREAMVNAAKHAGVEEISVYAEVEPTTVSVFVRDRGRGFDPDSVSADRHGLAHSIKGRMERNGGSCTLRTAEGEGTEIRLEMPVATTEGAAR